jgi:cobalamin biosynthesis Mg chelatase CobN
MTDPNLARANDEHVIPVEADDSQRPLKRATAIDYVARSTSLIELRNQLVGLNNVASLIMPDAYDADHCLQQYADTPYLDALILQHQELFSEQLHVRSIQHTATPAPQSFVEVLNDVENQCREVIERLTRLRDAAKRQAADRQTQPRQQHETVSTTAAADVQSIPHIATISAASSTASAASSPPTVDLSTGSYAREQQATVDDSRDTRNSTRSIELDDVSYFRSPLNLDDLLHPPTDGRELSSRSSQPNDGK